jgi:hypothetical protein
MAGHQVVAGGWTANDGCSTGGRTGYVQVEDTSRGKLHAELPGQVDMMGIAQPVSQLHSTKVRSSPLPTLPALSAPPRRSGSS